jgi:nucleoid-associated protein YgaU
MSHNRAERHRGDGSGKRTLVPFHNLKIQSLLLLALLGTAAGVGSTTSYTVRAGDTLFSLAQRSGSNV